MSGPILVMGVGRSGTSMVARVIHQHGIACMGHDFPPPDQWNPLGYFEDLTVMTILNPHGPTDPAPQISKHHAAHGCRRAWGFKHPHVMMLKEKVLEALVPRLIIRTWRPMLETVNSMTTFKKQKDRKKCERLYLDREKQMDGMPEKFQVMTKTIRFDHRLSEDEVLREIVEGLAG